MEGIRVTYPGNILSTQIGGKLAKPNYQYEKRQRDLESKRKKEEKKQSKLEKSQLPKSDADGDTDVAPDTAPPANEAV